MVGTAIDETSTDVGALRSAVAGSEDWQGEAASRWQTVMSGRVSDASLTNEVLGKAASLLDQLASDLETEQSAYNKAVTQMQDAAFFYDASGSPVPPDWDASYLSAMSAAASRATDLLHYAGNDFLALAALADDIGAATAADRTPGVAPGSNRQSSSLNLLTFLLGTVLDNQKAGAAFENDVLNELGLTKNTSTFRPGTAFEGRTSPGGLPRGTTPDAMEDGSDGYIVEIKGYSGSVTARFQFRLEQLLASTTGRPLWVIAPKDANVSPSVVKGAEKTGGGVLYRTGPDQYQDPSGNQVQVGPRMKVSGYQPSTTGAAAGGPGGPADPDTPSAPVNPSETDPAPAGGSGGAPAPADPDPGPVDPVDPDPDPIIEIP